MNEIKEENPSYFSDERKIIIEMLKTGIRIIKKKYDLKNGEGAADRLIDERGFPPSVYLEEILPQETSYEFLKLMKDMAKAVCHEGCSLLEVDFILIDISWY